MNADINSVYQAQRAMQNWEITNAATTVLGAFEHSIAAADGQYYKGLFERSTAAYEKLWRAFLLLAAQMVVLIGTCLWLALR